MSLYFAGKAPDDVVRRRWTVPVEDDDGVASVTAPSGSGVTVDSYELQGNVLVVTLSAGTEKTSASVTLHAVTSKGDEFDEKAYIAILPADAGIGHAETAQTIVDFALRPAVGIGATPTSGERTTGLEWLNGMLTHWRGTGADIGVHLPLALANSIVASDEHILAVKTNLRVLLAEEFGQQVSAPTLMMARAGLQAIKNDRLKVPETVEPDDY